MKNWVFALVLVFLLGFGSAHDILYKERFSETYHYVGEPVVSRTTYVYYDNDDRYSTYDYRHGYSYRATRDYFDRYDDRFEVEVSRVVRFDSDVYVRPVYEVSRGYRYDYVPHLRRYERQECYFEAPADRLFYVKC